jgi:hypothetical protein
MFGGKVTPTAEILLRSENSYSTTLEGAEKLNFFNNLKWWIGRDGLWETQWTMATNMHDTTTHSAFMRYENRWVPWLFTSEAVTVNRSQYPTGNTTSAGPGLGLTISAERLAIIKSIINTHQVGFVWTRSGGAMEPGAQIDYSVFLSVIFKPNIGLRTNHILSFSRGEFTSYDGRLSLLMNF